MEKASQARNSAMSISPLQCVSISPCPSALYRSHGAGVEVAGGMTGAALGHCIHSGRFVPKVNRQLRTELLSVRRIL
jgi:hypothetical protein